MNNEYLYQESSNKKLSLNQKKYKILKTIEQSSKEPNRKKFTINQYSLCRKKDNSFLLNKNQNPLIQRKIKSLSKYQSLNTLEPSHNIHHRKKNLLSQVDLKTLESMRKKSYKNLSLSKQKQRANSTLSKQKLKKSQNTKINDPNKKYSSISRFSKRQPHSSSSKLNSYYCDKQRTEISRQHKVDFKDINLENSMNEDAEFQHCSTLAEVFSEGFEIYRQLIDSIQAKKDYYPKQRQRKLSICYAHFKSIYDTVGELSLKNLLMYGVLMIELQRYDDGIMVISRVYQKLQSNFFLLEFSQREKNSLDYLSLKSTQKGSISADYKINLIIYLKYAQAFNCTKNYLCGLNVISKWQQSYKRSILSKAKKSSSKFLNNNFYTIEQSPTSKNVGNYQKNLMTALQVDNLNKLKKYNSTNNNLNSELKTLESKLERSQRNKKQMKSLKRLKEKDHIQQQSSTESLKHSIHISSIYLLQARLFYKIKCISQSIQAYKKCIQADNTHIEPLIELVSLYYNQGQVDKSLEILEDSIEMVDQGDENVYYLKYYRGLVLVKQGRCEEAYEIFEGIQGFKNLGSEICYYKGVLLLKKIQESQSTEPNPTIIEQILTNLQKSIQQFSSLFYVKKSYFYKILVLLYFKNDYYGAQYEVDRMTKIMDSQTSNSNKKLNQTRYNQNQIFDSVDNFQIDGLEKGFKDTLERRSEDACMKIVLDLIEAIILMLKLKINPGLSVLKQISLRLQTQGHILESKLGVFYTRVKRSVWQFKFYGYYIKRDYELALKYVNQLLAQTASKYDLEERLMIVNRLTLECMILMQQKKYSFALSKLEEVEELMGGHGSEQGINSNYINNNVSMVKSICYINLYSQCQEDARTPQLEPSDCNFESNREILLSAEQILRHVLITDKQNSLIYYLISSIHYELQQYESSLKYIRQAIEMSDDHMIKHYFCKANAKIMLGRYEEAIKDYSNAAIVWKEQLQIQEANDGSQNKEEEEEYYEEKQVMFQGIYLNRAIGYLKQASEMCHSKNIAQHSDSIYSARVKAGEDLVKYFKNESFMPKNNLEAQKLREDLKIFMYTQDPSLMLSVCKEGKNKFRIVREEDQIGVFYLVKELNNCISSIKQYIKKIQAKKDEKVIIINANKNRKESLLPPKYKRSGDQNTKVKRDTSSEFIKITKLRFDLRCLEALKKSSSNISEDIELSLIILLELTQQIYKKKEKDMQQLKITNINEEMEKLFEDECGFIFKWSDILFYIGVLHFQLKQYETAIKYFEQSFLEKKSVNKLYTLQKRLESLKDKQSQSQDRNFIDSFDVLFENRVYSKEEIDYNIGVSYFLMKNYKKAFEYLSEHRNFLIMIKQILHQGSSKNEVDQSLQSDKKSQQNNCEVSKSIIDEEDQDENITPFPTTNRLCSIYEPQIIKGKKFYLSFCLPKLQLQTKGLFSEEQVQLAQLYNNQKEIQKSQKTEDIFAEDFGHFSTLQKQRVSSAITYISLKDLQMKPIAPWIRQGCKGVIFTQCMINDSIEIISERNTKKIKKDKKQKNSQKAEKNTKNKRYKQTQYK